MIKRNKIAHLWKKKRDAHEEQIQERVSVENFYSNQFDLYKKIDKLLIRQP